ncbi:MAG: hypothetical protein ACXV3C_02425 [Actinomycetes bacterium]
MDDVMERGAPEQQGPPAWLRGLAVAVAVALALLVVDRTHLLSAGSSANKAPKRAAAQRSTGAPAAADRSAIEVVARAGDHLERYEAAGVRRLASLPPGMPSQSPLVHAPRLDGTGPLVGVNETVLFRVSATGGRTVTPIGRADRVISASHSPFGIYVRQPFGGVSDGPRVAELDAHSGAVLDRNPFPGYSRAWDPAGVMTVGADLSALLMTRRLGTSGTELVLAWDGASVEDGTEPLTRRVGIVGDLLGAADGRVFTRPGPGTCSGASCRVGVVTVTRDGLSNRAVDPPPGWAFGAGFAVGEDGDPVVGVARVDHPTSQALARLVAGGRRALLVPRSTGLAHSVEPLGGPNGSVVFAVTGRGHSAAERQAIRLAVWAPDEGVQTRLLDLPPLSERAELVCVCR